MALRALWDVTQQFQNKNGSNLTSGKIYIYYQGRTALATTYHDEDGTVVNSNPVLLDNNGRATAFADPIYSYTIVVCDYYGKELFSQDITLHDAISTAEDVVVLGTDGTVLVDRTELPNGVQYDLSVNTDIIATKEYVDDEVDNLQEQIDNKKDKQSALTFNGSATKTVKKVTQDANGVISVEYEDIDLPPEVPNVEITSPNGTIDVQSSTDVQTNTKTFTIDVNSQDVKYWKGKTANFTLNTGHSGQDLHGILNGSGNLTPNNLSAGLYLVTASFDVYPSNVTNELLQFTHWFQQDKGTYEIDCSIPEDSLNNKLSYEHVEISNIISIQEGYPTPILHFGLNFPTTTNNTLNFTCNNFAIFKLDNYIIAGGGGGGTTYTAGDGIDITSDTISVDAGKGLGFDADGKLEVKVGDGLTIDDDNNVITIDSEVGDVVETVEKLKQDLDTQLTVNFDMGNITHTYDFADSSVTTLSNGATMLCQAFTVPINHDIRIASADEDPTLLGIYAKQPYGTKIMLALYVYDFETEYTDYVGDTGPVTVVAGRNEFPLVHINPNVTELKSSCVYYAALYLPSSHNNGLYLASCPSYTNASYINATPRFTVGVENIQYNNQEIDMTDATTGRLDYNDGQGNYYIGPWSDSYNERPNAPRFFMQLRNGEVNIPVVVDPFDNISSYSVNQVLMSNLFTDASDLGSGIYPVVFRDVTPNTTVEIDWWESFNGDSTESNAFGGMVFDSGFSTIVNATGTTTVTEMGSADGLYGHKYTPSSPITLNANTTYRFVVLVGPNDSYNATGLQYSSPSTSATLHLFQSGWSINEWASYKRLNNVAAMPLVLHDTDGNTWRI